jgi:hypothetical protein
VSASADKPPNWLWADLALWRKALVSEPDKAGVVVTTCSETVQKSTNRKDESMNDAPEDEEPGALVHRGTLCDVDVTPGRIQTKI